MYEDRSVYLLGLLFGDEGKGSWTEFFASQAPTKAVVRTTGGHQAAHNICRPNGSHHTFSQFGAATFLGVPTILTKHMMVEPYSLAVEGDSLCHKAKGYVYDLLTISENSLVTSHIHAWINQKLEDARGDNRHGSTGLGIGETTRYSLLHPDAALRMKDLSDPQTVIQKLTALAEYAKERTGEAYPDAANKINQIAGDYLAMGEDNIFGKVVSDDDILETLSTGRFVFEGSQGVLLDQDLGFHPHTTWSKTTSSNAEQLLREAQAEPAVVVGLTRKYGTRHGAGPFPGEFTQNPPVELPEPHNGTGKYQGHWRTGHLALPLLEYAVRANGGVDALAISHWDAPLDTFIKNYENFPHLPTNFYARDRAKQEETIAEMMVAAERPIFNDEKETLLEALPEMLSVPVVGVSVSPTIEGKKLL